MIDSAVVSDLRDDFRHEAMKAIATLEATGVLQNQINLERERMVNGAGETDDAALTHIRTHRQRIALLTELQQLAIKYQKDLES